MVVRRVGARPATDRDGRCGGVGIASKRDAVAAERRFLVEAEDRDGEPACGAGPTVRGVPREVAGGSRRRRGDRPRRRPTSAACVTTCCRISATSCSPSSGPSRCGPGRRSCSARHAGSGTVPCRRRRSATATGCCDERCRTRCVGAWSTATRAMRWCRHVERRPRCGSGRRPRSSASSRSSTTIP